MRATDGPLLDRPSPRSCDSPPADRSVGSGLAGISAWLTPRRQAERRPELPLWPVLYGLRRRPSGMAVRFSVRFAFSPGRATANLPASPVRSMLAGRTFGVSPDRLDRTPLLRFRYPAVWPGFCPSQCCSCITGAAGVSAAANPPAVCPDIRPDLFILGGLAVDIRYPPLYFTGHGQSRHPHIGFWVLLPLQSVPARSFGCGPILPWAWSSRRSADARQWARPDEARLPSDPPASGDRFHGPYPLMGFARRS